jgi:hypothetical protein
MIMGNPDILPSALRAMDCFCGQHVVGTDEEDLFRLARAHIDRSHATLQLPDQQLRSMLRAQAYPVAAGG